jgi:hypothetical protein
MAQSEDLDMQLQLKYDGPAVADGSMAVYDVAANMMAFSDFVVAATHKVYGDDAKVTAEVRAFEKGSFNTELLFHITGVAGTLLSLYPVPTLVDVVDVMRQSLGLFNFLQGKPPAKVERLDDHSVAVTNNNGQIYNVHIEALNLTLDGRVGGAVERFIGEALTRPGIESAEVRAGENAIASVPEADAAFYRQIDGSVVEAENVVRLVLTLEMPALKDGPKWRFWDGERSVAMAIEDPDFLRRVDEGSEAFRKGDELVAEVLIRQTRSGDTIKTERTVQRVLEHRVKTHKQLPLPGTGGDGLPDGR